MKYIYSLLEFLTIGPIYSISKMLKKLQLGSLGGSHGMSEARVVDSFQHKLAPGFGGNSISVLTNLNEKEM